MTEREGHEPAAHGALEPDPGESRLSPESTRGHRGLLAGWRRGKLEGPAHEDLAPEQRQGEAERLELALNDLGTAARNLVELQRGHEQMERRLIEVERAATQRGEALAQLREHLHAREAEISSLQAEVASARLQSQVASARLHAQAAEPTAKPVAGHLLFIPDREGYSVEERPGPPPASGETVVLGSTHFIVTKVGSSPLPADGRPCSYLLPTSRPPTD